ncbi:pentapeptide repeat-containing protein [Scytonema sp. UIC 10036]|uniref:pentapeptide repeat-containing protein n=1 Tax=Scytonema sp. UIC 10036 TaxID=2304196 RepID=UPI0012DA73DA|nr:pentapeptide repeat-containing protein [Scytonema sp. UIC 10036]MUG92815.1 pentapeptide repeat-containing protein [Scytonema sp. UIC 10036]
MSKWRKKFASVLNSSLEQKQVFLTGQKLLIYVAIVVGVIAIFSSLYRFDWAGFGPDSNKSVSVEEAIDPKNGAIIKLTKKTEHFQSGKTLWDWLQLFGTLAVPVLLVILGNQLQSKEKEIADTNLREESLQDYIDRMSELLLDKNLKNLAIDDPLRDTALDVARARTLSVLRRLGKDKERKGSVIRFLIDVELTGEFSLSDAYLEGAYLEGVDLKNAYFSNAYFKDAYLNGANLTNANLSSANLNGANLTGANLNGANLIGANLNGANLNGVQLTSAKLANAQINDGQLNSANLSGANLLNTNLLNASLSNAHLEGTHLEIAMLERVNFSGANLKGANLKGANLKDVNLKNAEIENTCFINVKNLTPEQVKQAKNWQHAIYDPKFLAMLELPSNPAT